MIIIFKHGVRPSGKQKHPKTKHVITQKGACWVTLKYFDLCNIDERLINPSQSVSGYLLDRFDHDPRGLQQRHWRDGLQGHRPPLADGRDLRGLHHHPYRLHRRIFPW